MQRRECPRLLEGGRGQRKVIHGGLPLKFRFRRSIQGSINEASINRALGLHLRSEACPDKTKSVEGLGSGKVVDFKRESRNDPARCVAH